jgi:tetratricopeptide (TPR) repeat protein
MSDENEANTSSSANSSGSAGIDAQGTNLGGDVVGRDKIINVNLDAVGPVSKLERNVGKGPLSRKALFDLQRAIERNEQTLALARNIGDQRAESKSLGNLGHAYYLLGRPQRALVLLTQAGAIASKIHDLYGEIRCLGLLGLANVDLVDMHDGIKNLRAAAQLASEIGDRRSASIWWGYLGLVSSDLGSIDLALAYLREALRTAEEIGDWNDASRWAGNLGLVYADQRRFDRAYHFFQSAVAFAHQADDQRIIRSLGNPDSASFKLDRLAGEDRPSYSLTPQVLADEVIPYVTAVAHIQTVLDEVHGFPVRPIAVESLSAGSADLSMTGVAETIDKIDSIVEPWRRKYAQRAADLALSETQADIEKKNAEVLQMRAQAAKTREERSVIEAEAALKWAQAEELQLKNQKARLELEREKIKMYLEFISALGVELSPEEKLLYVTRLKGALDTVTDSPLMLMDAAPKTEEAK